MEQHIDAKQGLLDCAMGREEEQRSALSFGLTLDKCRCHHTDRQTDKHKSENKATVSLNRMKLSFAKSKIDHFLRDHT